MEATFATLTDEQRIEVLNNIYQKGISTPQEKLAFSSDKLVYLKPFLGRLLDGSAASDLNSRMMVRQIVDELIRDIMDDISASSNRSGNGTIEKLSAEYGLRLMFTERNSDFYTERKVA